MDTSPVKERTAQHIPMRYEEYLTFAGEARIVEWRNGETLVYIPPLYEHQNIVTFLTELLHGFIRFFDLGALVIAPFEVKLWPDGPAREPDLIFVNRTQQAQLSSKRFTGGPALLVEVVSPGSVTEDRVRKFEEYEQAGVGEYWIIDPRPRQKQVDFYVLDESGVYQPGAIDDDGRYHTPTLPHFWLQVDWFTTDALPNAQLALAEIMLTVPDLSAEARQAFQALHQLLSAQE